MKKTIRIIHTNDTHSYVDHLAKRKHLFDTIRQESENVLFLDSGDNITGSLFYTIFHGQYESEFINQLKYDAMTLGNHEFDNGSKSLKNFLKPIQVPILLSNVNVNGDWILNDLHFEKTKLVSMPNGIKVGLFGLVTPTAKMTSSPSKFIRFKNPHVVAIECVDELKKAGADVIIALSHLGDDEDVILANHVEGIDVIVGAHTHRVIESPLIVGDFKSHQHTLILQAGSYGKYVGDLEIDVEKKNFHYKLHDLEMYQLFDKQLNDKITDLMQSIDHVVNREINITNTELIGKRVISQTQSTNLTNLITDAYLHQAKVLGFNPDIAIMNSGGIRKSIDKGSITYGDIVQVLPFSCELVVCKMSGQQLYDALKNGEYPQVANAQLYYECVNEQCELSNVLIRENYEFKDIKMEKEYVVVTNSFIASGKDHYIGFHDVQNLVENTIFDTDIVIEYLCQLSKPFNYCDESRIFFKK